MNNRKTTGSPQPKSNFLGLPRRSVDKASAQVVSPRMNIVGLDWTSLDWTGLVWTGLVWQPNYYYSFQFMQALPLSPPFFLNNIFKKYILTRLSLSTTLYKGKLTKL
jgi:hypothetical protein